MKIVSLNDELSEKWDEFAASNPSSTIYHDSSWLGLVHEVFGYRQRGLVIIEEGRIKAGIPLFEVKGLKGKRLISNPFRDRGGLLSASDAHSRLLLKEAVELCRSDGYDYLMLKEEKPIETDALEEVGLREKNICVTTRVDLTKGAQGIWRNLKNNAKGPVLQARGAGVRIRFGESLGDMDKFYNIFLRSRRDLGIPAFSRSFFFALREKMCSSGKAKLFLAERNNFPVAGMILFIHRDTVIDAYAASLLEHKGCRPNDLLVWSVLEWASAEGYKIFDFGADFIEQRGLLDFKRKWTGVSEPMHYYFFFNRRTGVDEMNSSDKRYYLLRKAVRKLPLPLFRLMSELVVARLGY